MIQKSISRCGRFSTQFTDGEDLRDRPLLERKRRLRATMPAAAAETRVLVPKGSLGGM